MVTEVQSIDDTYFDDDQVNTDYFEEEVVKRKLDPIKASESALITSILAEGGLTESAIDNTQIETNFILFGDDPTYQQVVADEKNSWKKAILEVGPKGLLEEDDTVGFLKSLDESLKTVDKLPERPMLVTSAAELLSNPNEDYGFLFEEVMAQVAVDQSLSRMLEEAEDKVPWTFGDWVELLTISPATERAFYGDVLSKIGLYEGATDYAFRAPHAERVANWIREGKSVEETKERLRMFIDAAIESGDNGIFSSDFLLNVRDQLQYANDTSALNDIFEMFVIADIKDIARGLKYLGTWVLSQFSRRSGKVDAKAISDAEEITREMVDIILPRRKLIKLENMKVDPVAAAVGKAIPPLRGSTDSLLDTVYKSNPQLVGSLVRTTAPEDLPQALQRAGITPEKLATRFSPGNGTEGGGMHISRLRGNESAMPVVSPYSSISQELLDQIENTARQSLYTPAEVRRGVDREIEELRRASNGVLQPQNTKFDIFDETDEISIVAQFGKTADKGYSTIEEAQFALSRLMGVDNGRIVARVKGSGAPAKPLSELKADPNAVTRSSTGNLLEKWTLPDGSSYELYQTGESFKSVVTSADGVVSTTRHRHHEAALKNKVRKTFEESEGLVKKSADELIVLDDLEYLVEANFRHTLVPMDANVFGDRIAGAGLPLLDYAIPYSMRISDEMFNTITSFVGRGDAVADKMTEILKPLRRLRGGYKPGSEGEIVNKLLIYGDEMGVVFTKQSANDYLGGRLNNRIWNAYKASREYFDIMHEVRNKREYLSLHSDGFRSLVGPDGKVLSDSKGAYFGKAADRADITNVRSIVDDTGKPVEWTADLFDKVQEAGGVIVKTHRDITYDGENYFNFVLLNKTDQVKPLTPTPLTKRTGHVDVMYRPEDSMLKRTLTSKKHIGGTGAVVKMKREITLNGLRSEREDTVGIFANEYQANQWISMRDPDGELGLYSELTRERSQLLGLSDTPDLSGIPSHAMGRGERLYGPKGPAEILNPLEVIESSFGEIRRTLNNDVIDILKQRFMRTYSEYTTDPSTFRFPSSVDELVSKIRKEHSDKLPAAREFFKFIHNQETALSGRKNSKLMDAWLQYANSLYTKDGGSLSWLGQAMESVSGRKFIAIVAKANQLTAIAGRVLFQAMASFTQAWTMAARDPILFGRTISGSIGTISGLLLRKVKPEGYDTLMDFFGWMNGMDGKTFRRYLDQIAESGIVSTDISDDVISILLDATKIQAGNLDVLTAAFWKNTPRYGVKALTLPIDGSIMLNKIMGYVHATNMYRRDRGSLDGIFSNVGRDRIRGDMDKLTFTQSRTDQFTYQQNELSMAFQFMHHVHKMWLNTYLAPIYGTGKTITDMVLRRKFDLSEKVTNSIYADTKAQALITFGMATAMFGARQYLPDNGISLEDKLSEYPKEARVAILDGMFNLGFHQWWRETFNVAERFAASDFHRDFFNFIFNEDASVNLFGPSTMLFDNLAEVKDWVINHHSNQAMSTEDFLDGLGTRVLRIFAGYRDDEKAEIVKNLGIYPTSSGMNIAEINPDAHWAIRFSLTPMSAILYRDTQEMITNDREFVDKVVGSLAKDYASWVARNPNATPEETQAEIVKMYQWLPAVLGYTRVERIEYAKKKLADYLINPDDPAVARQIKSLFQVSGDVHEAMLRLRLIKEQYPELVDDHLIQYLEKEYETIKENK